MSLATLYFLWNFFTGLSELADSNGKYPGNDDQGKKEKVVHRGPIRQG